MNEQRYKVTKKGGRFRYYDNINRAVAESRNKERIVDRWTGQAYTVKKGRN